MKNVYMVSKYFTVLLADETKFSNPCHALKSSVAVKGLMFPHRLYFCSQKMLATYVYDYLVAILFSDFCFCRQAEMMPFNRNILKSRSTRS